MLQHFDIIVCGSLHLDIVVHSPHLPRLDETATGSQWKKVCGGKGGNQAVMSARAGATCAMIARVGQDDFGTTLIDNLVAHGVDTKAVSTDPNSGSGMSVAILDQSGDYGAVIVSGSNLALTPDIAVAAWKELGGAKVLILQNEIPENVSMAIAHAAKSCGSRIILNAAPARAMSPEFLDLIDVLIVNRIEAEMLVGHSVSNHQSAMAALPILSTSKRDVIITLGGEGLAYMSADGKAESIPPVKVKVVSSHGAGDCFVGALAAQLAKNAGIATACKHANKVAAAYVSRINSS